MNIYKSTLVCALFFCTAAIATTPSDATLRELLEITQSRKLIEGMQGQIRANMDISIQKSLNGKIPTAKEQQAMDSMKTKMVALAQSELAWEKLEPLYLGIYKESFTEEEVNDLLAFYKTTAGQALINKMPLLMEKVMGGVQNMLSSMAPRMQAIQKEFMTEIKAATP